MSGSVAAVPSYFHRTKAWSCQNPVSHLERRERGLIAPPPQTLTPTSLHPHLPTKHPHHFTAPLRPHLPVVLAWQRGGDFYFGFSAGGQSSLGCGIRGDVATPIIPKFSTLPSSLSGMASGVFYVFLRVIGNELCSGGGDGRSEALSTSETISVFNINLDQI